MSIQYGISGVRELITDVHLAAIEFPSPSVCQLNRLFMRIAAANSAGDTLFDVKKNDVSIYGDPLDRPKILAGETTAESFPTVELIEGDMITVDVVGAPPGGITGLYVLVQLQDAPTVAQYIKDAYNGALGRDPDAGELSGATTDLQTACTAETTLAATLTFFDDLFTSAEYLALATTNTVYVEDLYQAILGRPADAGGLAFWVAAIVGGMTRADARESFNSSTEHVNQRVLGWCPNTLPINNAVQIQGQPVNGAVPNEDDTWIYQSGVWVPAPPVAGGATGAAGGVLSGTYPNPGFAVDMATQAELNAVAGGLVDEVFTAEDDGFDVSTLDPKWTESLLGAVSPTVAINPPEARSCYLVKFAGAGLGYVQLEQLFAPAGDFALTVKFRAQFRDGVNSQIDLYILNTAGTDGAVVRLVGATASTTFTVSLINFVGMATIGSLTNVVFRSADGFFLHIQRVGTLWTALLSFDGVSWQPFSAAMTKTSTVNRFVFQITQSTTPIKERVGIDWIRRDWFVW